MSPSSGPTAPVENDEWKFAANTTRTTISIPFGPSATGDTVWITAFWSNSRDESGPAAAPVSVNLPAGGSVTYTAVCAVSAAASGTTSNTATVAPPASVTDTNAANNSATDVDTVTPAPGATLTATKTVTGSGFAPGTAITYTIVIANGGTGAQADNPGNEFVDTLPAGLTLTSASATSGTATAAGNVVSWNGAIPAGGNVTITITATINASASGTIANQGTVAFDADGNGTNESTAVTDDPATGGGSDATIFSVAGTPAVIVPVPTLTGWMLLLLALGLAGLAWRRRLAA